jgi:hypothetical protein
LKLLIGLAFDSPIDCSIGLFVLKLTTRSIFAVTPALVVCLIAGAASVPDAGAENGPFQRKTLPLAIVAPVHPAGTILSQAASRLRGAVYSQNKRSSALLPQRSLAASTVRDASLLRIASNISSDVILLRPRYGRSPPSL